MTVHVTFCSTWLSRSAGGLLTAMAPLARCLDAREGFRISAVGVWDDHLAEDRAEWGRIPLVSVPCHPPRSLCFAPGMSEALIAADPDLVHQHGIWSWQGAAVLSWHRRAKRPYVISPHGMLDPWILSRGRFKKWLASRWFQNRNLERAACIHALCPAERDHVRKAGIRGPIAIIPNGLDPLPEDASLEPPPWRDDGRRTLLFLSRLHPKKGLEALLDGWSLLKKERPSVAGRWRLLIAGWGDDDDFVARLRAHPAAAEFLGPLFGPAKAGALRNATAVILPSHGEGLPMTLLEAWQRGRPTLQTAACNLPEGIDAGAARLIEPTAQGVLAGIEELDGLSDAHLRAMGSAGAALVGSKFTRDLVASAFLSLYTWIRGGGPPPAHLET